MQRASNAGIFIYLLFFYKNTIFLNKKCQAHNSIPICVWKLLCKLSRTHPLSKLPIYLYLSSDVKMKCGSVETDIFRNIDVEIQLI